MNMQPEVGGEENRSNPYTDLAEKLKIGADGEVDESNLSEEEKAMLRHVAEGLLNNYESKNN